MNKQIWKYQLQTDDLCYVDMLEGAEVLCLQMQNSNPCIWALVDASAKIERRVFQTFGTGQKISTLSERKYVGTYQLMNGLVLHVFEWITYIHHKND